MTFQSPKPSLVDSQIILFNGDKINFKKEDDAEELEYTSETQEDTSETLEDASPPYIENGKLTEVNGIISQKTFLTATELPYDIDTFSSETEDVDFIFFLFISLFYY